MPAAMAYGEHKADLVRKVPRSMFEGVENLHVGMKFQTNTGDNAQVVQVMGIDGNLIRIDANHPLAGFTLYFDLEVIERREATLKKLIRASRYPEQAGAVAIWVLEFSHCD